MPTDPRQSFSWPYTWTAVYAILSIWLLGFLAVAFLLDWLKGVL